jgi:hypothetical protein
MLLAPIAGFGAESADFPERPQAAQTDRRDSMRLLGLAFLGSSPAGSGLTALVVGPAAHMGVSTRVAVEPQPLPGPPRT